MLVDSMRRGNKRIVLAAPCAYGKTVLAGHLLQEAAKKGKKGAILCDRVQLIEQSLDKFDAMGMDCGVIQGQHERTNWGAQTKIISIQTLARRKRLPELDFVIVDECHTLYKTVTDMMDEYNGIPVIGLSATPYSKGMGKYYQDIVVPVTTRQLLDQGYLCPVKYFAGAAPDLEKVKLKTMRSGGREFDDKSLAAQMEKPKLIGNIVKTWKDKGENSQTIAFCPSKVHSQGLVKAFMDAGVPAVHIDDKTPTEDRKEIYEQHNQGVFKVLSCCMLLNTGYDSPSTRCLIDARPTKSLIAFVQRAGRILRNFEGKEYGIYLDHASNVARHGFPEDVVPEELDDGETDYNEKSLTKQDDQGISEPRACPKCSAIMQGVVCGACGAKLPPTRKEIETVEGELMELQQARVNQDFYSELMYYANEKGKNAGWVGHTYKQKFGSYPSGLKGQPKAPSSETLGYIKHLNIKRAKGFKRRAI